MLGKNLIIILGFWLIGCGTTLSTEVNSPDRSIAGTITENRGQMLPITARAYIKDASIDLEVARTGEQQAIGLMYRSSLPKNRGMLFPFPEARYARFWMKNVSIPLDMIFLEKGVVRAVFIDVPPCSADPCPVYGPSVPIDSVIELAGGRARELGVKKGDTIRIESIGKP
ncbi:DUF192 domain-containing protein [Pannus brasiliensis CCIBt3594]|uniref:DUF192 domain-containing protein n=1 Tax=Pannus brasiliensis CCIBt3594 TaxID=1427578 RepID=A0AAW9QSK7_9CHRO